MSYGSRDFGHCSGHLKPSIIGI